MTNHDATGEGDLAGRVREQAQCLLKTIHERFGTEGLKVLEQVKHQPGQVTPGQMAAASHIRAELGPDVFWLSEALSLWRNAQ